MHLCVVENSKLSWINVSTLHVFSKGYINRTKVACTFRLISQFVSIDFNFQKFCSLIRNSHILQVFFVVQTQHSHILLTSVIQQPQLTVSYGNHTGFGNLRINCCTQKPV